MADIEESVTNVPLGSNEEVDIEGINVPGLVSIIVFYLIVLFIGIWAGWKQRKTQVTSDQETVMLAGRNIGLFVGVLTMGATWVGGGFINGSAEATYKDGLVWTQAPIGYSLSLWISGLFFAKKMRDAQYVTMIDPFTQKYGKWGALQALPAAVSEIFWSASILGALGSTLQVILQIDINVSIIISAIIAVCYTLIGGLISVAYTDVFQLFFIAFGLFLSLPFALEKVHEQGGSIDPEITNWVGEIKDFQIGEWIDYAFLLLLGGIPWQCYYQRVLSSTTSKRAVLLSFGGGLIALIMTVPSVTFGMIAKATDWSKTDFGRPVNKDETGLVLPLCLQYLTPTWVAFFGLGAISAAVMSSTDSSMLSASTMLARNVYKAVFRPSASEKEVLFALWGLIVLNCTCATALAIHYKSIYDLFVLCGDFVFVIVFPQLLLVLYYDKSNTYGSLSSFIIGLTLRLLCGDKTLGLDSIISFGKITSETEIDEDGIYKTGEVPYRTFVMLITLVVHVLVSTVTHHLFMEEKVPLKCDVLKCYRLSQSTGLVEPGSSRHLETNGLPNGITLEDLANRGSFVPRPHLYDTKQ